VKNIDEESNPDNADATMQPYSKTEWIGPFFKMNITSGCASHDTPAIDRKKFNRL
jgi:hypothetical protein